MDYYSIDYGEVTQLRAAYAKAPAIVREELGAAVREADLLLMREVSDLAPVGAGGAAGFKGSLFHEESIEDSGVTGLVSTSVQYAVPVELGTRPHFPPIQPLIDWVRAKLAVQEEATARGIAFAIARKISVRGTEAQRPFGRVFQAQEEQVRGIFDAAVGRIAARLGAA